MTDVLGLPVLVLNRHFSPIQVTTVKRAFVLLYGGAAQAVDEEGEEYDFDLWRTLPVRDGDDIVPSKFDAVPYISRMINKPRHDGMPVKVRMGLLVNGVDVNTGQSGTISAMHGEEEMGLTVDAFRATVRALKREGAVA